MMVSGLTRMGLISAAEIMWSNNRSFVLNNSQYDGLAIKKVRHKVLGVHRRCFSFLASLDEDNGVIQVNNHAFPNKIFLGLVLKVGEVEWVLVLL